MPFKSDSIYFRGEARSSMYMCYLLYTTKLSSFLFIIIIIFFSSRDFINLPEHFHVFWDWFLQDSADLWCPDK